MYMYRGRRRSTAAVAAAAEEKRTTTIVVVQNVSVAHAHAITSGSGKGLFRSRDTSLPVLLSYFRSGSLPVAPNCSPANVTLPVLIYY